MTIAFQKDIRGQRTSTTVEYDEAAAALIKKRHTRYWMARDLAGGDTVTDAIAAASAESDFDSYEDLDVVRVHGFKWGAKCALLLEYGRRELFVGEKPEPTAWGQTFTIYKWRFYTASGVVATSGKPHRMPGGIASQRLRAISCAHVFQRSIVASVPTLATAGSFSASPFNGVGKVLPTTVTQYILGGSSTYHIIYGWEIREAGGWKNYQLDKAGDIQTDDESGGAAP